MKKMDRLTVLKKCIVNDENAIKELEMHLAKLYEMYAEEAARQEKEKKND